jgi:hypothetical protein
MDKMNAHIKLVNQKVQFSAVSDANPGRPSRWTTSRPSATGRGLRGSNCSL